MFKRQRRGFTLLELIVVIVILAILAVLAVPTFKQVISNSQDETTRVSLQAAGRNIQALSAFEPEGGFASDDRITEALKESYQGSEKSSDLPDNPGYFTWDYAPTGDYSGKLLIGAQSESGNYLAVALDTSSIITAKNTDKTITKIVEVFDGEKNPNPGGEPTNPGGEPTTPGGGETTPPVEEPQTLAAPAGFSASWNEAAARVDLTWGTVNKADGYRLYRSVNDGENWQTLTTSTTSSSFADTTSSEGRTYIYKIEAFNSALTSDPATVNLSRPGEAAQFVSTWVPQTSTSGKIILPLTGTVNGTVDWGDGSAPQTVTAPNPTYTYKAADRDKVKTITFSGTFTGLNSGSSTNIVQLRTVDKWTQATGTTSAEGAFKFATNLTSVVEPPSTVTTFRDMFTGAGTFNVDISNWDTSNVTNMQGMFAQLTQFNQPIGKWNTSKVTTMSGMFQTSTAFNSDISNWNTSNVTTLQSMFYGATNFNQPIGKWNTSKVAVLQDTFNLATSFDQDLSNWDTSNVANMTRAFQHASKFNGDITTWKTPKLTNLSETFWNATSFNQDISGWDTSKVLRFSNTFNGAKSFNQDLSGWVISPSLTSSYTTNFDLGADAWVLPKPNLPRAAV